MVLRYDAVDALSAIIGWTYMLCWTISFYPQFILNIRRKTTRGFSIDFALLNILGMASYAIHNTVMFCSSIVRDQYARRNPRNPTPTVRLNDVAYAIHGALITVLIYSQFYPALWHFTPIKGLRCSRWSLGLFWGCSGGAAIGALIVLANLGSPYWEWLDVIYLLGNIKAFLTLIKYAPQVGLNFQRKSTRGLSMLQFTLDLTGAFLSLAQLVIDSVHGGDWSAVLANPAKLALGNVTVFFDIIFFFQHSYLYRGAVDSSVDEDMAVGKPVGETDPLLATSPLPRD